MITVYLHRNSHICGHVGPQGAKCICSLEISEGDCVSLCPDCASGPHDGGDSVPRAQHLRVPDLRVEAARLLHHRERRAGQQDQRLLPASRGPLQRDELAEETQRWGQQAACACLDSH